MVLTDYEIHGWDHDKVNIPVNVFGNITDYVTRIKDACLPRVQPVQNIQYDMISNELYRVKCQEQYDYDPYRLTTSRYMKLKSADINVTTHNKSAPGTVTHYAFTPKLKILPENIKWFSESFLSRSGWCGFRCLGLNIIWAGQYTEIVEPAQSRGVYPLHLPFAANRLPAAYRNKVRGWAAETIFEYRLHTGFTMMSMYSIDRSVTNFATWKLFYNVDNIDIFVEMMHAQLTGRFPRRMLILSDSNLIKYCSPTALNISNGHWNSEESFNFGDDKFANWVGTAPVGMAAKEAFRAFDFYVSRSKSYISLMEGLTEAEQMALTGFLFSRNFSNMHTGDNLYGDELNVVDLVIDHNNLDTLKSTYQFVAIENLKKMGLLSVKFYKNSSRFTIGCGLPQLHLVFNNAGNSMGVYQKFTYPIKSITNKLNHIAKCGFLETVSKNYLTRILKFYPGEYKQIEYNAKVNVIRGGIYDAIGFPNYDYNYRQIIGSQPVPPAPERHNMNYQGANANRGVQILGDNLAQAFINERAQIQANNLVVGNDLVVGNNPQNNYAGPENLNAINEHGMNIQ